METMGGIYTYTPFLIILMSALSLSQHHVCLKYKDMGHTIEILCSVDRLIHQIGFKNPAGEESGDCEAPIRIGKGMVECSKKFKISQDLTTNMTRLIIVKNKHMYGEWKCYHGTNIGSDSVDIKMPAFVTVDISPTVGDVLEGDNQTITCTVSGKPVATDVSWTKSSKGGFETIDRTVVPEKYLGGNKENPTLVIKDFTTSDTGTYVCKATNAVGTAFSQPAVLTCKRKTSIAMYPEGSIWIGLGGTTKLTANITTTSVGPFKIYWQRVENNIARNIVLNTIKYSGSSCDVQVPVLVINDVDTTDAGLYQVEVTTITGSFIGPHVVLEVFGDVKESNPGWKIIILLIIIVIILIVPACFGVRNFVNCIKDMARRVFLKKMAKWFFLKKDTKTHTERLLEYVPECTSCRQTSICAICIDGKYLLCEICCESHNRLNPHHKVFIIEDMTTSNNEVICEYCNKLAIAACLHCVLVLCDDCKRKHTKINHNVKMLIKYNGVAYQRGNTEGTSKLEHKYTISPEKNVEPLRIRGIAFLTGDRILLIDSNTSEIRIFEKNSLIFNYQLKQESKCITKLYDNCVAISFPHEREIKIYDIVDKSVNLSKVISVESIGKPFSISYSEKHFAVEIGEGNNGAIFIINEDGGVICSVPKVNSFASFTGNTIRLALDMENRRIFVSALGRKSVHCIDFNGYIIWCKAVPSPRGIVFIPEASSNMNMIVASKQLNRIYKMNSHTGTDNIITAEGLIKGPRHMDYNMEEKLLCVEIDNGKILVFKYDINVFDEPD